MSKAGRPLTEGERTLAASVFGDAIAYDGITIRRKKWFPLQPRHVAMAPCGHIHFHPKGDLWSDDFALESIHRQGLFIHEMTHVWQTQQRGRFYLPLMRHPFCRYAYTLEPGRPFDRYGLEQQAEIVRHAFLLQNGRAPACGASIEDLKTILPFSGGYGGQVAPR